MKKFQSSVIIGITALLSGCACDCDDDSATINIQFEGFTEAELKTIYVINTATPNIGYNDMAFSGNSARLGVGPNSVYQLKSDSVPLNKVIRVNEIRSETTKQSACECTNITGIDYEYEGSTYTNQPVVITR